MWGFSKWQTLEQVNGFEDVNKLQNPVLSGSANKLDLDVIPSADNSGGGMTMQQLAGISYGIGALSDIAGAYAQYAQDKVSAGNLKVQADLVGLQAEQKANQLREKLFGDISNSFAGYAARGIDIGSGTPITQAEMSLKEGGEDIQQIQKNAEMQADSLRKQADIIKSGSKANMWAGMASGVAKGALSLGMLYA